MPLNRSRMASRYISVQFPDYYFGAVARQWSLRLYYWKVPFVFVFYPAWLDLDIISVLFIACRDRAVFAHFEDCPFHSDSVDAN